MITKKSSLNAMHNNYFKIAIPIVIKELKKGVHAGMKMKKKTQQHKELNEIKQFKVKKNKIT